MPTPLTCKQCGYSNEPERVYCHNCGEKLDRSPLFKEEAERKAAEEKKNRRRKFALPKFPSFNWTYLKTAIKIIVLALVVAFFIQIARPPSGLPTVSQEQILTAPDYISALEEATKSPKQRTLAIPEQDANAYLRKVLRGEKAEGFAVARYMRSYVQFNEGSCSITVEHQLLGHSFFATSSYLLERDEVADALKPRNLGGAFGRVPVSSFFMSVMDRIFNNLWTALDRETQLILERMESVNFHERKVEFTTRTQG